MRNVLLAALTAAVLTGGAIAQEQTVGQLINDDYEIVGVMPSSAGPGILLKKLDRGTGRWVLVMCFVAETSSSPDIATQYCKPVN